MTKKEVLIKITSEHKWYVGHYSQGYASQLIQKFELGLLKQKTIDSLFNKFGYFESKDAEYALQLEGKPSNLKTK